MRVRGGSLRARALVRRRNDAHALGTRAVQRCRRSGLRPPSSSRDSRAPTAGSLERRTAAAAPQGCFRTGHSVFSMGREGFSKGPTDLDARLVRFPTPWSVDRTPELALPALRADDRAESEYTNGWAKMHCRLL